MNDILSNLLSLKRLTQVVDIGANPIDGEPPYKKMLAAGLCHVVGFEPQVEALNALNKAKSNLEQYLPYTIGTGIRQTLYRCAYSGWTSLLEPDESSLEAFPAFRNNAKVLEKISVNPRPLDSISEISDIDFLKLDVQGSELDCLQSGKDKLVNCVLVQIEVSFITLYKNQPGLGEVDVFLRSIGFVPHCFAAIKRWPIAPIVVNNDPTQPLNQLLEADLVYVKNFLNPNDLSNENIKHMAMLSHYCFSSFDLAARCILLLESRNALKPNSLNEYILSLS
jgi:FkbM family methyltransferase